MDFLKKAAGSSYKFLQELDDSPGKQTSDAAPEDCTEERPKGTGIDAAVKKLEDFNLEARLEGVSNRLLGWAGSVADSRLVDRSPTAKVQTPPTPQAEEEEQEKEAAWSDSESSDAAPPAASPVSEPAPISSQVSAAVDSSPEPQPEETASAQEGAETSAATVPVLEKEPGEAPSSRMPEEIAPAMEETETSTAALPMPETEPNEAVPSHPESPSPVARGMVASEASSFSLAGDAAVALVEVPEMRAPEQKVRSQTALLVAMEEAVGDELSDTAVVETEAAEVAPMSLPPSSTAAASGNHYIGSPTVDSNEDLTTGSAVVGGDVQFPQEEHLRELSRAQEEVAVLWKELATSRDHLGQRERQIADLSQHLADKEAAVVAFHEAEAAQAAKLLASARKSAAKEAAALQKRAETAEAARDKALRNMEREVRELTERTERAERKQKEDANDTERELLEAQETWRKKIATAEQRAVEAARDAKQQVAEATSELEKERAEVVRLRHDLAAAESCEDAAAKEFEDSLSDSKAETQRISQRLGAATEVELQLRRELSSLDQSRSQLQERATELAHQLERVQAAYSEAAQEIGAMSARLHELEFGSQVADRPAELEERLMEAERRLTESATSRDQALRQLEEMHQLQAAQLLAHQAELAQVAAAATAMTTSAVAATGGTEGPAVAANAELEQLREVAERFETQLHDLERQHGDDLKKQAQMFRDEAEYLKRKNDEKDRRLEVLICERNTLRFESAEQKKAMVGSTTAATGSRRNARSVTWIRCRTLRMAECRAVPSRIQALSQMPFAYSARMVTFYYAGLPA